MPLKSSHTKACQAKRDSEHGGTRCTCDETDTFESKVERKGTIYLWKTPGNVGHPSGAMTRIMMMPIVIGDIKSVPREYQPWHNMLSELFGIAAQHGGKVGYLTIDEKTVKAKETHRRAGLHVDGVYRTLEQRLNLPPSLEQRLEKLEQEIQRSKELELENRDLKDQVATLKSTQVVNYGGGWGGQGGGWGSVGNGMLTVSDFTGCRAWAQTFHGPIGDEGGCENLRNQCKPENEIVFGPKEVFWLDGLCVHESLPMPVDTHRTFVRLSMPSNAAWFEGYTVNPLGVLPTGPILPRRTFMDS